MECDKLIHLATELQSLAQAGLYYGKDVYDRERYTRIREIAAEMITLRSDLPYEKVTEVFCADSGYQTPPYAYGVVKLFYLCEELGGEFRENSETTTADYFAADDLPPLAEEKCNADQVLMCFRAHKDPDMRTVFD